MTEDPNTCPICNNPKTAMKGSLTQWVNICRCDGENKIEDIDEENTILVCSTCNKRVEQGKHGSLTQFIFRADKCNCEKPSIAEEIDENNEASNTDTVKTEEDDDQSLPAYDENIPGFPYERFRPLKVLGSGASSIVYLARDQMLDKRVAVKMLHSMQEKQMISFHEEAKATSKLSHTSIVQIIDFGASSSDAPYMVLEFIDGISLKDKLSESRRFEWGDCESIFAQVLSALSYAHEKGIFHRDIKPSNILLAKDGGSLCAKVIDFGIAKVIEQDKLSEDGKRDTIAGSPLYMSPDSGHGRSYDARSEVYSIGCVLFECLTGSPPFKGDTPLATLSMHAKDPVPEFSEYGINNISPQLEGVIRKALEKDPDNRFQSIDELKNALSNCFEKDVEEIVAREGHQQKSLINRNQDIATILLALIFLATIPSLAYFVLSTQQKTPVVEKQPKIEQRRVFKDLDTSEALWRWEGPNSIRGYNINDESLKEIGGKYKIRTIKIMPPNEVTGIGLKYIEKKKRVRAILFFSEHFNEDGAFYVTQFPNLAHFKVSHTKHLTLKAVNYILTPKQLKGLELKHIDNLPAGTLEALGNNKSLEALDISDCAPITEAGVTNLAKGKQLSSLKANNTAFSDSMARSLLNSKIVNLSLNETKITDQGLATLSKLKSLRSLSITLDNDKITEAGVARFKKIKPDCTVNLYDQKNRPIDKKPTPVKLDPAIEEMLMEQELD